MPSIALGEDALVGADDCLYANLAEPFVQCIAIPFAQRPESFSLLGRVITLKRNVRDNAKPVSLA